MLIQIVITAPLDGYSPIHLEITTLRKSVIITNVHFLLGFTSLLLNKSFQKGNFIFVRNFKKRRIYHQANITECFIGR